MPHANVIKIMIFGQTDAELAKLGVRLKPLHEVRLSHDDGETVDAILKRAEACLRAGDFAALEKLGVSRAFCREALANIAQRYQKNTSHDYHISELSRIGGFTPFETAMIIIEAAEGLKSGETSDAGSRIRNSAVAIRKIMEKLPDEEERGYLLLLADNLCLARPRQHDYPFTHRKNTNGDWVLNTD